MPLGKPGGKKDLMDDGRYYPTQSIVFKIDNENGANVSIIANGADCSIYSFDSSVESGGVTRKYTMRSKNYNSATADLNTGWPADIDKHRYFTYNAATGVTGDEAVPFGAGSEEKNDMLDNNALYAHIFKLPKGEYCIGADSGTANIYFLAVQGQTDATIGDNDQAAVGDAITDVDFLLDRPTLENFPSSLDFAKFSFSAKYDDTRNTIFNVGVTTVSSTKYISLTFVDNPQYVTYLLLIARSDDHTYYINGNALNRTPYVYPRV